MEVENNMSKKTHQFQAEVKEILDLMVHSLYSNREIFLREIVSNASDAIDKLRFEEASNPELANGDEKYIRLVPNKEAKTLTIIDNGIGMNSEEVLANIGTIAHSGTKSFIEKAKELKDRPDLIGQFGVGFYSSFMVADKVTLHTQKAGTTEGVIWESTGDGSYTMEEAPRELGTGTSITLHLKDFKDDETAQDYTDEFVLRNVIKKYSDFIEYSIKMEVTKELPELDEEGKPVEGKTKTVIEDEVLNSKKQSGLEVLAKLVMKSITISISMFLEIGMTLYQEFITKQKVLKSSHLYYLSLKKDLLIITTVIQNGAYHYM